MKPRDGKSRRCAAVREWSKNVIQRDGGRCQICGEQNKLHAHHIIGWNEDDSKRLDIDNGITYFCSCHLSVEKKGKDPWIKGKKHSEETKKKMSASKIGHIPWNYGQRKELEKFKSCRICGVEKSQDKFTKSTKGYYENRCKDCRNYQLRMKTRKVIGNANK